MSNESANRAGLIGHRFQDRVVLMLDGWLPGRRSRGWRHRRPHVREAPRAGATAVLHAGAEPPDGPPDGSSPADYPAAGVEDGPLDGAARRLSGRLMRVNHAGEVSAQALYLGQSVFARDPGVARSLGAAAGEERSHLHWCRRRLDELAARPSRLYPLWWAGSFAIGTAAGAAGDAVSLGFLAETERQVVEHLTGHLERLPEGDHRSRAICRRMLEDERRHGRRAAEAGGRPLPASARLMMRFAARVMTASAYRV